MPPNSDLGSFFSWYLAIPGGLGVLSGYQAVASKFPAQGMAAVWKLGTLGYLLTRILIPVGFYAGWYFRQVPLAHSLMYAVLCGVVAPELVLRSRFYIGESKTPNGTVESSFKGVFDLVAWYQRLFLESVGNKLAKERGLFVSKVFEGETSFLAVFNRSMQNSHSWMDRKTEIQKKLNEVKAGYQKSTKDAAAEREYMLILGLGMLDIVGKAGLETLNRK